MNDLRFTCLRGCIECCNEPGFVYLAEADLAPAAALLHLSTRQFEKRYVYRTKNFLRLRKPIGAQCPFLSPAGCRIHSAKPTQCRAFPFWPELIAPPTAWREAARRCPGIGRGKVVPLRALERAANDMRQGYPTMYED